MFLSPCLRLLRACFHSKEESCQATRELIAIKEKYMHNWLCQHVEQSRLHRRQGVCMQAKGCVQARRGCVDGAYRGTCVITTNRRVKVIKAIVRPFQTLSLNHFLRKNESGRNGLTAPQPVCIYMCICIHVCVHMCISMCVCTRVCMHMCVDEGCTIEGRQRH